MFAVEGASEDGAYYILNGEGTVLGVRDDASNRLGGARNVLLQGFDCVGEKGEKLSGDMALAPTLEICALISQRLNGIRGNVSSIQVIAETNTVDGIVLMFQMQEGVKLYLYAVERCTQEKAIIALETYLALSVDTRMSGSLMVYENLDGELTTAYRPEGGLPV